MAAERRWQALPVYYRARPAPCTPSPNLWQRQRTEQADPPHFLKVGRLRRQRGGQRRQVKTGHPGLLTAQPHAGCWGRHSARERRPPAATQLQENSVHPPARPDACLSSTCDSATWTTPNSMAIWYCLWKPLPSCTAM